MRFLSVTLRNFGPFLEQSFDFSKGQHGLHLIYGPNEAGKSSALRGLRYFLFGFPERTKDDFTYNKSVFRIHATLANARGDILECVRRKGRKETLRAGDDKTVLSDETLRAFIGGLSEEQFKQLFGLDHQLLDEGGRLIAEGKGDLGEAIFAAGAGLAGLRHLQNQLDEKKDAIYKARGKSQALATELQMLERLRKQVLDSSLAAEVYAAKEEEYRSAQTTAEQSRQERDRARAEHARLERFQDALPFIDQLRAAREGLRDFETARTLAEGFEKDYRETAKSLIALQTSRKDLDADIERLESELKKLELPASLLAEQEAIEQIKEQVAVWSKAKDEALKADSRKREMEARARDIFRDLTGSTDLEQAKTYRLTIEETERIRALGRERALLQGEFKSACNSVAKLEREIADALRKLEQVPKTDAPAGLKRTVDLITREGRIDEQLSELTQSCAQEESKIRDALARLNPPCTLPLERVTAVPLPLPEAIEWHRQELERLKEQLDRSGEELRAARQELIALDSQIEAWERGEAIPTEDELAEMRRNRDAGLYRVRQRLAGHSATEEEEHFINRFAPARALVDAVEASVRQCDSLADRLRREADRVARGHSLKSQRDEKKRMIAAGLVNLEQWKSEHDRAQGNWKELWEASGIVPDVPEVMSGWLNHVSRLRERIEAWHASVQGRVRLEASCEQLFKVLTDALPEIRSARSLQDGLERARDHLKATEEVLGEQKKHQADLQRLRSELASSLVDRKRVEDQLQLEQQNWAQAVSLLRLPESVDIATVESCLDRTVEMEEHLKDARIKAAQIRDIESNRDALLQRLNELRLRLAPSSRMTTLDLIEKDFAEIDRKLSSAQDQRAQHEQVRKLIKSKLKKLEDVTNEQRDADAKLAAMAKEAGVSDPGELPDAIDRARRRSEAMKYVHDCENTLAQRARGMPIHQFELAALKASDGIDQAIVALEDTIKLADQEVANADIAANQADVQLKEWRKASEEAAKARQEAAFCTRRLQDHVAEYATLHLARHVLGRAVERYRSRNQDTMLARAASFFEHLTDGDFATLEIQHEDGNPVLKAVRSDRTRLDAIVSVLGLSDGTRDQLFLALRLAGIERHLADREPMPLIIDDVLINFDDRRACATLRCIAELSKQTQVLLFTHHHHLVELAQKAVSSQLVTHQFTRLE